MATSEYRTITAQYNGRCAACGGAIRAGESILYARGAGSRHTRCAPREIPADVPTWHLSQGEGYGGRPYVVGDTFAVDARRIASGWPEYVTVIDSSSRYYAEDGMSFGVGDDRGRVFSTTVRAATEEEAAAVRERRSAHAAAERARQTLEMVAREVEQRGERPHLSEHPKGARIAVQPYREPAVGDFRWLVITSDALWAMQDNGADGDNWGNSNLPGTIGWRVPRDMHGEKLVRFAREAQATITAVGTSEPTS